MPRLQALLVLIVEMCMCEVYMCILEMYAKYMCILEMCMCEVYMCMCEVYIGDYSMLLDTQNSGLLLWQC